MLRRAHHGQSENTASASGFYKSVHRLHLRLQRHHPVEMLVFFPMLSTKDLGYALHGCSTSVQLRLISKAREPQRWIKPLFSSGSKLVLPELALYIDTCCCHALGDGATVTYWSEVRNADIMPCLGNLTKQGRTCWALVYAPLKHLAGV